MSPVKGRKHGEGSRYKRRIYTSWPQRKGQMNFDLNNNLAETPYQNSNKRKGRGVIRRDAGPGTYTQAELVDMNIDQHTGLVNFELDSLQAEYLSTCLPSENTIQSFGQGSTSDSDSNSQPSHAYHEVTSSCGDDFFDDAKGGSQLKISVDELHPRITTQQLIQEVKGIYAGLVMVEKKCIDIVNKQTEEPSKLTLEQWQALIALHRTLLNEHHDFFSATHHPVGPPELRGLASRYAMPARMWKHGILPLLNLLRRHCDERPAEIGNFLRHAFEMLNDLESQVPDMIDDWSEIAINMLGYVSLLRSVGVNVPETDMEQRFRDTYPGHHFSESWIECLGDLARYRMAMEEPNTQDRDIWSNVARAWYNQAVDLSPSTGRIQYHLAVLARRNPLSSLACYYSPDHSTEEAHTFQHLPTPPSSEPEWSDGIFERLNSNDSLWALMAGWYWLGGHVSRNLRAFYKVFAFLPWAAASLN